MIQSVQELPIILTSNTSQLTFNNDDIRTRKASCCGWLQHNENSPLYKVLCGGLYEVSFNANVTSATAGPVAIALFVDGVIVPGTTVITTVTTAGSYENVAFNKEIEVCCGSDSTLTVASVPSVLTGVTLPGTPTDTVAPIYQDANFRIAKKA